MPLAVDSDSVAFQIGEWSPAPILMMVGLLLLLSGRRAGRESPGSGGTKRGWGIGLMVLAGVLLAARIATEVKEATDDAPKSGTAFTSQSAKVIASTAIQQMQDRVASLKIKGTTSNADVQSSFETTFDVEGRCRAKFKEGDAVQTFIFDGKAIYVKANRAGWRSLLGSQDLAQDAVTVVAAKWAAFTPDDLTEGMTKAARPDRFCDFDRLFDSMEADRVGGMTVGDTTLTGGVESIELLEKDGSPTGSLWIETAAPHHILRFVVTKDGVTADISFSDFNEPLAAFGPAKRDLVDLR